MGPGKRGNAFPAVFELRIERGEAMEKIMKEKALCLANHISGKKRGVVKSTYA
jgi:hypothetical protein